MVKPVLRLGPAPVLFSTVCFAVVSTIFFVHRNQTSEKEVGHFTVFHSLFLRGGPVRVPV